MLRAWEIGLGALVVDMSGATAAMAGALTLVTMPWTSRIVSLVEQREGREGDPAALEAGERLWISVNPWDEGAEVARREASDLFNRGAFVAAGAVFRRIESRVSGGQKPLYRALADLAEGYDLWDRFHYRQAWDKLKTVVKALEMASVWGGPPGLNIVLPAVKQNAGFLEKLVLDPQEVKEAVAVDLLAHARRRADVHHHFETAITTLLRALEAFA